jgi:hypothetical protein
VRWTVDLSCLRTGILLFFGDMDGELPGRRLSLRWIIGDHAPA